MVGQDIFARVLVTISVAKACFDICLSTAVLKDPVDGLMHSGTFVLMPQRGGHT